MDRRSFLKMLGLTATPPVFFSLLGCPQQSENGINTNNVAPQAPATDFFANLKIGEPLNIPPLYTGELDTTTGTRVFDLTIRSSSTVFAEGYRTDTWSINPPDQTLGYLGPTLRLRNNEAVSIRYTNELSETTTIHGHGMHVPAAMDGGPHQRIAPGNTWAAEYTVNQPACTGWYHPHEMGKTAEHVYRGLAGMIIVEDDNSQSLELPNQYGVDDIPLVLQDRVFDSSGQLNYSPSMMEIMRGYRGTTWLTNGQIRPRFLAQEGLLRLRLLNGANAGLYQLSLSNGEPFYLIAMDNGFIEQPRALTTLLLTPGERAEIVLDLNAKSGETISLQATEIISGNMGVFLDIEVGATLAAISSLPANLATLDLYDPTNAIRTRTFTLDMQGRGQFAINGKSMDINRIDEEVPVNELEIWEVTNQMGMPHNFHIHAAYFVPLDRNGSANNLQAWERNGYKDTIYVPAGSTVRLLVKMTDYTDPVNPYMYHCHFLEHEDAGMMGQFTVV